MALNESFAAAVRSLEREYEDQLIQEQSSFRSQAFQARITMSSHVPQGLAAIARKKSFEFVKNAAIECETLQNLSDAGDFEEAVNLLVDASNRLLLIGSHNPMIDAALNQTADALRLDAAHKMAREVRDRLLIAKDKRRAMGKTSTLGWTLLFLQSNPRDEEFLATNHEFRDVQQALRGADYRDQIQMVMEPAVRIRDVFRAINEHRPQVIHFSGHGNQTCLALLDEHDQVKVFDSQHMAELIAANDDDVKLVVLNSCDSLLQAQRLLTAVPHVIGTNGPLDDDVALLFSRTFYEAIANGRSIATAFTQATIALRAESDMFASDLYNLLSQENNEATTAYLVTPTVNRSGKTS